MIQARRFAITLLPALCAALRAADGDLDTTFSSNGLATYHDAASGASASSFADAVAKLPDGSLLVGGWGGGNPVSAAVVRVRPDGSIETGFGDQGWLLEPFGEFASLTGAIPLADGKILLVGNVSDPVFARFDANGNPDLTFGPFGRRHLDAPPFAHSGLWVDSAALDLLGRIVLRITCFSCNGSMAAKLLLVRLDADAELDPNFGFQGWSLTDAPSDLGSYCTGFLCGYAGLAIDDASRIVVSSAVGPGFTVHRFLSDGAPDPAFGGGDGRVTVDIALDEPTGIAVQPSSGAIVLGVVDHQGAAGVLQLEADGDIDSGFGFAGLVNLSLEEGTHVAPVLLQSDGRIVAVGSIDHTGTQEGGFFIARLLPDGALDESFDDNGVVRHEFDLVPDGADSGWAGVLSSGRLVAVGRARLDAQASRFAVLRTQSSLIFADGFERGTAAGWGGS